MTHTTCLPTRAAKSISRWLIAACAACTFLPASAQAGDHVNRHVLLPVVDKLHADVATFEQLASRRWFPDHEFDYIKIMTQKACRLADAVKCGEHFGRIRADYDVLRVFVRTVDQRLCRHRASQFDHQLMGLWNSIKHDLDGASCLVRNTCSVQCGHLAPPVHPRAIHRDPRITPRGPAVPPLAPIPPRDFGVHNDRRRDAGIYDGRFSEPARGSVPEFRPGRFAGAEPRLDARRPTGGNLQHQPGPAPAWFDLLSAVLAR